LGLKVGLIKGEKKGGGNIGTLFKGSVVHLCSLKNDGKKNENGVFQEETKKKESGLNGG